MQPLFIVYQMLAKRIEQMQHPFRKSIFSAIPTPDDASHSHQKHMCTSRNSQHSASEFPFCILVHHSISFPSNSGAAHIIPSLSLPKDNSTMQAERCLQLCKHFRQKFMKGYIAFGNKNCRLKIIYVGKEPEGLLKLLFKELTSKVDEGIWDLVMLCFELLQG